ncbi:MAG: hypothetical protein ACPHK1_03390 [Pseudohongiellaceae bacterium]
MLKALSEQIREAGANPQPTVEFELADELPDRFHVMKQRLRTVECRGAQAASTALASPDALRQRFATDRAAG